MPLVVPVLRLSMLFLNVYETFKTLKTPPLSARNGGRPSIRAMSQRKRDMKGCLAIWIVWFCFTTYERLLEAIVSIFIPFYDELKSLVLLFLILTRARGAEPIYLHVIRPLVKPYTSTLDSLLDITCAAGDFLFLVATFPLRYAISWWQNSFISGGELSSEDEFGGGASLQAVDTSEHGNNTRAAEKDAAGVPSRQTRSTRALGNHRRLPAQTDMRPSFDLGGDTIRARRQALQAGGQSTLTPPHTPQANGADSRRHEIWYPPPSAYESPAVDENPTPKKSAATSSAVVNTPLPAAFPPLPTPPEMPRSAEEIQQVEEWRQYPPFPSAYPPTPLVTSLRVASQPSPSDSVHLPSARPVDVVPFPAIAEDPTEMSNQGFGQSLQPPREHSNPSSAGSSSDDASTNSGIRDGSRSDDARMAMDDEDNEADEENESEEDDFNVTLRTPLPPLGPIDPRVYAHPGMTKSAASSSASLPSTTLTTNDNGSSLRTRTTSESSGSLSISDSSMSAASSSVAGHKRPYISQAMEARKQAYTHEHRAPVARVTRGRAPQNPSRPQITAHMVSQSQQQILRGMSMSSAAGDSDSDNANASASEQVAPEMKRRRVAEPRRRGTAYATRTSAREAAKWAASVPGRGGYPTRAHQTRGSDPAGTVRIATRARPGQALAATLGRAAASEASTDISRSSVPAEAAPPAAPRRASDRSVNSAKRK